MKLLKQFIQQETVLTAAAVLAVVSAFFVLPDAQYLGYIDLRTLAILFSLMTVMAGLRRQGFFDGLGRALLSRTHSTFQLTLVLVGLCFFGSMFITNDVSLLTFVPFTFVVLSRLGADVRRSLLIPVVCIFIGNLGRIPAFSGWLQEFLTGREVLVAVLASQVTSNVPAALLLSGFTAETQALIIGTNLGGLGTLIASMASLISYRQIARELPQGKKQYFGLFTLSNLIFLAILLGVWFLLR